MIHSEKELSNELVKITEIHVRAKIYLHDAHYLFFPPTGKEIDIADRTLLIWKIREAFWKLGIIEIAKLFQKSKNQNYNLLTFLDNLIDNYECYDWLQVFPIMEYKNWRSSINSPNISRIREEVSILRDNYFAHTDRNPKKITSEVYRIFEDLTLLINITEDIIFNLRSKCFLIYTDFDMSGLSEIESLIEAYIAMEEKHSTEAEIRRKKLAEELKEYKSRNRI